MPQPIALITGASSRIGAATARRLATAVYAGVARPLLAEDVADCVAWCATRPHHVHVVRPLAQAARHKVHRVRSDQGD